MEEGKSSRYLTLVLIGAIGTTAVVSFVYGDDNNPERRDVYGKLQDCKQDWVGPADCEPVREGPHSGGYYGPSYSGTGDPPKGSHALSSVDVTRGGFGGHAGLHSSGG